MATLFQSPPTTGEGAALVSPGVRQFKSNWIVVIIHVMILLQRQATTPSRIHESCGQGFLGLARILGSLTQFQSRVRSPAPPKAGF